MSVQAKATSLLWPAGVAGIQSHPQRGTSTCKHQDLAPGFVIFDEFGALLEEEGLRATCCMRHAADYLYVKAKRSDSLAARGRVETRKMITHSSDSTLNVFQPPWILSGLIKVWYRRCFCQLGRKTQPESGICVFKYWRAGRFAPTSG